MLAGVQILAAFGCFRYSPNFRVLGPPAALVQAQIQKRREVRLLEDLA